VLVILEVEGGTDVVVHLSVPSTEVSPPDLAITVVIVNTPAPLSDKLIVTLLPS